MCKILETTCFIRCGPKTAFREDVPFAWNLFSQPSRRLLQRKYKMFLTIVILIPMPWSVGYWTSVSDSPVYDATAHTFVFASRRQSLDAFIGPMPLWRTEGPGFDAHRLWVIVCDAVHYTSPAFSSCDYWVKQSNYNWHKEKDQDKDRWQINLNLINWLKIGPKVGIRPEGKYEEKKKKKM